MEGKLYQPSPEEIENAENSMTTEQKDLTMKRLGSFGLGLSNFDLTLQKNNDSPFFLTNEIKKAAVEKISEFEVDKLWEIRNLFTPFSINPMLSYKTNSEQLALKEIPEWITFVGEAIEDELQKRGLVRRGL